MTRPSDDQPAPAPRIVAIDGPAGSGKSTVGRRLADALGLEYLDTGAMYRAITHAVVERGVDADDDDAVAAVARTLDVDVSGTTVTVDGIDVSAAIRTPEITRAVSRIAAYPGVRVELVEQQRTWARRRGGGVLEGRDIGTVVFPDAALKVYLTASPRIRAERRAAEMGIVDPDAVADLEREIERRDTADSSRDDSPLSRADDAIEVLTDDLDVDQVVTHLLALMGEDPT